MSKDTQKPFGEILKETSKEDLEVAFGIALISLGHDHDITKEIQSKRGGKRSNSVDSNSSSSSIYGSDLVEVIRSISDSSSTQQTNYVPQSPSSNSILSDEEFEAYLLRCNVFPLSTQETITVEKETHIQQRQSSEYPIQYKTAYPKDEDPKQLLPTSQTSVHTSPKKGQNRLQFI
jgi:hypothetical protein